jgi:hypothetical protein
MFSVKELQISFLSESVQVGLNIFFHIETMLNECFVGAYPKACVVLERWPLNMTQINYGFVPFVISETF